MSAPMEVDNQEVSGLVAAAAAAAVEAAASEDVVHPLFAETVAAEADIVPEAAPETESEAAPETESEATSETESEAASETESEATTESETEALPAEVTQWVDEIDNIQYHYTHDDDDRGYNFFRDTAGNTLFIQEFDIKGTRYLNINREHIMKSDDFFNILCAHKDGDNINMVTFGQQTLRGCSTDLLVEAFTILGDTSSDSSSDSSSDASSESSSEEESEPQPNPSPIPTKSDSDSVQNFLIAFFLVLMGVRAIGLIGQLV